MMNKIICIAGMSGSGKKAVADYLTEKAGFLFIRFGQIVLDEIIKKGLSPIEKNERKIREDIRRKHGMAAMAILNLQKFKNLLSRGNVVADGLYSWSEYKYLKKEFGEKFILIAVFAPPQLRYLRLENRFTKEHDKDLRERPSTREDAIDRDYAEIENIEKGGPIAMADYTLINTRDLQFLYKQIDEILIDLKIK